MFANLVTQTAPPLAGFNGAALLALIALSVAVCFVCLPHRSMEAPPAEITGAWRAHYVTAHPNTLDQCRACERGNHDTAPHPANTGAPCQCSCTLADAA